VEPRLGFDAIDEAYQHWTRQWPEAAASMAAATSIMRAQQIVLGAVDAALKSHGLTFARYEALVLLSFTRSGSLPLGKMGQRLMIHPTSVTNIVDRLVHDGLVERVAHPSDRRTTLARITSAGRELVERATLAVNAVHFGVGSLDETDQRNLVRVIRELRRTAGDFADDTVTALDQDRQP